MIWAWRTTFSLPTEKVWLKSYVCEARNLQKKPGHHKALEKENNVYLLPRLTTPSDMTVGSPFYARQYMEYIKTKINLPFLIWQNDQYIRWYQKYPFRSICQGKNYNNCGHLYWRIVYWLSSKKKRNFLWFSRWTALKITTSYFYMYVIFSITTQFENCIVILLFSIYN